jgi:surface antigen
MQGYLSRTCFFLFSVLIALCLLMVALGFASNNTAAATDDMSASASISVRMNAAISTLSSTLNTKGLKAKDVAHSMALPFIYSAGFVGNTLHASTAAVARGVSGSVRAVAHTPGNTVHLVASATNVKAFIKPADTVRLPAIGTVAATPIPHATPAQPAPAPVAPKAQILAPAAVATSPLPQLQTANLYAWGNCTWWASLRRSQTGVPIPNSWGNAATWATRAARDGYVVDHHPSPRAIMQTANSAWGLGHVAFVESVGPDGTWHISEMNVLGLNVVDRKAEPPSLAATYNFIH